MAESLKKIRLRQTGRAYEMQAEAVWIGEDRLVHIWGGDKPHIGAVAMAQPRPSLADPAKVSATASVFTYVGHKEDDLVKSAAESLAAALDCKVVVAAGAHWEGLDAAGLEQIKAGCASLLARLLAKLKQG